VLGYKPTVLVLDLNSEIADQLYLSVRTVETHRSHIQRKLGVSSRAELVRYALDNDLIDR
jgi:two-component system response regulator NreC